MGARLRLKGSIDVMQRTSDPAMQKIFRAMQKHGLIVADNGSDMFITGTYDPRWNIDILNPAFGKLTASDFEVIQLGYNPQSTVGAVQHLRASLEGKRLALVWDRVFGAVNYQIQISDRIDATTVWQPLAATTESAWSGSVSVSAKAQFFRVMYVAE